MSSVIKEIDACLDVCRDLINIEGWTDALVRTVDTLLDRRLVVMKRVEEEQNEK